ncbi:MAG: hypothetical protein AAF413_03530 [Patescibacteria group bacterium]
MMEKIRAKIQSIEPRELLARLLEVYKKHNLVSLFVIAGVVISFTLLQVRSYSDAANNLVETESSASQDSEAEQTTPDADEIDPCALTDDEKRMQELGLISVVVEPIEKDGKKDESNGIVGKDLCDKDLQTIVKQLNLIRNDEDVFITSNIASYRRSVFSDSTNESAWVIQAAGLLESFKASTGYYPVQSQFITTVTSQAEADNVAFDPAGADNYTYTASECDSSGQCSEFDLRTTFNDGSIYQLGENDYIRRTWINDMATILDLYSRWVQDTSKAFSDYADVQSEDNFTRLVVAGRLTDVRGQSPTIDKRDEVISKYSLWLNPDGLSSYPNDKDLIRFIEKYIDVQAAADHRHYYGSPHQFAYDAEENQGGSSYTVEKVRFELVDINAVPIDTFAAADSQYLYKGIDCGDTGCDSYVLRTTFKDDASYFQQSF